MSYITDAMHNYLMKHYAIEDSKEDIQRFIDKFGNDTYELFLKSKDRLKNNNISTDILWHVKNTEPQKMKEMLYALRSKVSGEEVGKIAGNYNYIGNIAGYDVYEPLDVEASMALGVGSGWCITGRYGHAGDINFKPSYNAAKMHWNSYTSRGIKFFFYLKGGIAKYAVCVYPNDLHFYRVNDKLVSYINSGVETLGNYDEYTTNIEIYDQYDNAALNDKTDISIPLVEKLQVKHLPDVNIKLEKKHVGVIKPAFEQEGIKLYTDDNILKKVVTDKQIDKFILPKSIVVIDKYAFEHANIGTLQIDHNVKIEDSAFYNANINTLQINHDVKLERAAFYSSNIVNLILPSSMKTLPEDSCLLCKKLRYVNTLYDLTDVGQHCFRGCKSLVFDHLPKWDHVLNRISDCILNMKEITIAKGMFYPMEGIGISGVEKFILAEDLDGQVFIYNCPDLKTIDARKFTRTFKGSYFSNSLQNVYFGQHIDSFFINGNENNVVNIYVNDVIMINGIFIDEITRRYDYNYKLHGMIIHTNNQQVIDFCKHYKIKYVQE